MQYLYVAVITDILLIIASIVFAVKKHLPHQDNELCRLSETKMTVVLGFLMAAVGVAIAYMKILDPTLAGEDKSSYLFVSGFSVICALGAVFTVLFTYVKVMIAFSDKLCYVSFVGKEKSIAWNDITGITGRPMSKSIKITATDGSVITVNGSYGQYKKFVETIQDCVKPLRGKELLENLERRMNF